MDFAAFWVALVISITTYYLAASLVDLGMSWWQGVATVFVGNIITLAPLLLNAQPGTKYGIPFPVLARASFGIKGSNLPSLARALVACGWFGIQTWVGGSAIHQMASALAGGPLPSAPLTGLGISAPELACFVLFWLVQVAILVRGMESIRVVEKYSAPVLVGLSLALLAWALTSAGGWGPMLAAPSQFGPGMAQEGRFWAVFWPAVTANVGYWATLSLNIPDFTRFAKSQRDQVLGQALGLPLFMALFTFLGLAVTSATVVMYGAPVTDPVQLLGRMGSPFATCLALFGLVLATLTTNIAANVVAPANALVNLSPARISFLAGALVTATIGLITQPWRLVGSTQGFVMVWLIGYSALLGPVVGIVLADYYVLRQQRLDIDDLYSSRRDGQYWYQGGWNPAALLAVAAGALPCLPGLMVALQALPASAVPPLLLALYDLAWFFGTAAAAAVYLAASLALGARAGPGRRLPPAADTAA